MAGASDGTASRGQSHEVPRDFTWVTGLGDVVSIHRAYPALALLLVPAVAFSILLFGYLGGLVLETVLRLPKWSGIVVAGVLWAASLGAAGYWLGSRGGRAAVVYEGGLAVKDAGNVRAWRWADIEAVSVKRTKRHAEVPHELGSVYLAMLVIFRLRGVKADPGEYSEYRCEFRDVDGGTCVLDQWLPGVESIGAILEAEAAKADGRHEAAANRKAGSLGTGRTTLANRIPLVRRTAVWSALLMASGGVVLAAYLWFGFFHVQDRVPPRAIVAPEIGRSVEAPDVFGAPAARITVTSGTRGSERAAGGSRADRDNIELLVTYRAVAPFDPDPFAWHFTSPGADFGYANLSLTPGGSLAAGQEAVGSVRVSGVVVGVPAIITYKGAFDDAPLLVIQVAP